MRKRSSYRQKYPAIGGMFLIKNLQPLPTEQFLMVSNEGRIAYQKLVSGTADPEDIASMWSLSNVVAFRSESIGGPTLEVANKAIAAAERADKRYEQTGLVGLDGPAIQELKDAIDLFDSYLELSDLGALKDALIKTSIKRVSLYA